MPQLIVFIAASAATLGTSIATATAIFYGVQGAIYLGLSLGLSYLQSVLFKPQAPKPEDVQSSIRNPTAPRQRHYGRVKASGPWVFAESKAGALHKVVAIGTGELDAIEEVWIDDTLVTIDGSGNVTTEPWYRGGSPLVRILTRKGLATETHYTELGAEFAEWDADHRGDGVSSLYALQRPCKQSLFSQLFPNGVNTNYRVVLRGSKVYNPLTALTEWTDNAAAIIRDYIVHPDGMRLPASIVATAQAVTGWSTAATRAAATVPLKAGGTEATYRLWGSYRFEERPADVVGRMLACCDGRLVPTPDGGLTLDIGSWAEPTFTLTEDVIVGINDISMGRDVTTTANVIRAGYMSPLHDYQTTDADQWIDEADVLARGEYAKEVSFIMSPSHGQTRRLMKLESYRANPRWIGTFQCNMRAMAAFTHRFVRVTYPLFGIDEVFEVLDFRFDKGEGDILLGVTLQVQSMPETAYDWDAATEEGTVPISEFTTVDGTIPLPTGLNVTIERMTVGGVTAPYSVLTFDPSPNASLKIEAQGKRVTDTAWTAIGVAPDATTATGFITDDVSEYEFQLRLVSLAGREGDWTASFTIVANGSLDFHIPSNSQYLPIF